MAEIIAKQQVVASSNGERDLIVGRTIRACWPACIILLFSFTVAPISLSHELRRLGTSELLKAGGPTDFILGSPKTDLKVFAYVSLASRASGDFYESRFEKLKARFIDTGKVRWVVRDLPIGALALAATAVTRCASSERRYAIWMSLMRQQALWLDATDKLKPLRKIARQHRISKRGFNRCLTDPGMEHDLVVKRDAIRDAFGLKVTPTFYFQGQGYEGLRSLDELETALNTAIKE